jgi:hypothetical protein
MAKEAQSRQESLMDVVCGRLLSAPFVFFPTWTPMTKKVREPADLVWACNNCIVLLYLQQVKRRETDEENKSKFVSCIEHNLRQARGALRRWQRSKITGRNPWHHFHLPRIPDNRIIILSVVDVGEGKTSWEPGQGFVEIHTDWAREQKVHLCATVPQSFLGNLAAIGGSALDGHFISL